MLFLLRQIVDYDSLLLFLEQKEKCHWDFPRDMKGKPNFLFPSAVLSLSHGEQEWSGLSDLGSGRVLQAGVGAQHCIESCVHLSWEWFLSYHTPGSLLVYLLKLHMSRSVTRMLIQALSIKNHWPMFRCHDFFVVHLCTMLEIVCFYFGICTHPLFHTTKYGMTGWICIR